MHLDTKFLDLLCQNLNLALDVDSRIPLFLAFPLSQRCKCVLIYSSLNKVKSRLKNHNKNFPHFPPNSYWKNHPEIVEKRKVQLSGKIN
jgi:hypothetical protein